MSKEETGWLIKRSINGRRAAWLCIATTGTDARITWTYDSNEALRFGRKQDAEQFVMLHADSCMLAFATEHGWSDAVKRATDREVAGL